MFSFLGFFVQLCFVLFSKCWFCCFLFVWLLVFLFFLLLFFFFVCLFVSWFPFVCSFCLVCFFFFSRWKGYFNFLVGRVNDSCSAGQSMSYVSILEAYNSFVGRWEGLDVSKKSFIIAYIPNKFF